MPGLHCRHAVMYRLAYKAEPLYDVSQKTRHSSLAHNFAECLLIVKILVHWDSAVICNKFVMTTVTKPFTCCYTTVWNIWQLFDSWWLISHCLLHCVLTS